ncbi:MAG: EF-P lysine aminoacylase EpmA [Acidobacteria bacterium]|nr:EF-P lysine aminoacylase EpmA [Acidobacteriota bacterium]MDW7984077.1 EF-P lysine aminoacylase EpmA [Acidobacteriota bacterium]
MTTSLRSERARLMGPAARIRWGRLIRAERPAPDRWVWTLQAGGQSFTWEVAEVDLAGRTWRLGDWWLVALEAPPGVPVAECLTPTQAWSSDHPWAQASTWTASTHRWTVLRQVRQFFYDRDYTEVDTPLLVASPGMEPFLDPFETTFAQGSRRVRVYLPYSPEYGMKKLLTLGWTRIFQIAHAFRNGELSRWHEPEFLLLEWYRALADYQAIMTEVEALLVYLTRHQANRVPWDEGTLDLTPPWPRVPFAEAIRQFTGIDIWAYLDDVEGLRRSVETSGLGPMPAGLDWNNAVLWLFISHVEPRLGRDRPVFIIDYPASMAALARVRETDGVAERFELYVGGLELANGFTELTDPVEQARRFEQEREERIRRGVPPVPVDEAFLESLRLGLPPAGGVALGIDRLIAFLMSAPDVAATLPFPFAHRLALEWAC